MTLKPLADKVVVKRLEAEEKTKSGIYLAAAAQEKPEIFEVVAVGPGGMIDGNEVKTGSDLTNYKDTKSPGDKVTLEVYKYATGATVNVEVVLSEQTPE